MNEIIEKLFEGMKSIIKWWIIGFAIVSLCAIGITYISDLLGISNQLVVFILKTAIDIAFLGLFFPFVILGIIWNPFVDVLRILAVNILQWSIPGGTGRIDWMFLVNLWMSIIGYTPTEAASGIFTSGTIFTFD